jgi:outer membrane protein assembly factor BamB
VHSRISSIHAFADLLLGMLACLGIVQAEDWSMYRADAARTGYASTSLPGNLTLHWTHSSASAPKPAWPSSSRIRYDAVYQPIMSDGLVVFGSSSDDSITALDAETGCLRWRFFTGGPVRFAPVAWEGRLFVASDDGYLYALRLVDGKLLWKHLGGPNRRQCMGNGRMISRWPARGGPVLFDETIYYAAGIWPSDGVYLHALDAASGEVIWSNTDSGQIFMSQPHPGAEAYSGVSPQGYLLANDEYVFVPNGRSVPAAFLREDGSLSHYLLQENGSMGASRALLADRFIVNGGCFLDQSTGKLGARAGRGVFGGCLDGLLRYTGDMIIEYHWEDMETRNNRGDLTIFRGLAETSSIALEDVVVQSENVEAVIRQVPAMGKLFNTEIRFREIIEGVATETGLERTLSQSRPDIVAMGGSVADFSPTSCEMLYEVICLDGKTVCGGPNSLSIVDLNSGEVDWKMTVQGSAIGLAASENRLIASTTDGFIYCFGSADDMPSLPVKNAAGASSVDLAASEEIDYSKIAEQILTKSGVRHGVCIDVDCETGRLALELAKQSDLQIIGLNADADEIREARRFLHSEGMYGTRVTIQYADPSARSYPTHVANLVLSSSDILRIHDETSRSQQTSELDRRRLTRPYGGVICSGSVGDIICTRIGDLEGAGQWTHQNADAANTLCSDDELLQGPLEAAWYRDGVFEMPDRHAQGPAPLFHDGYLVVEGVNGICALDAYNGQTLWTYTIEGLLADWDGVHHDVGISEVGGVFCLGDGAVFARVGERCLQIDLATGDLLAEFHTPVEAFATDRNWGCVVYVDGILYGSVLNDEHTVSSRYEGIRLRNESTQFFAINPESDELLWRYVPEHSVRNNAFAIGNNRVYLIDRTIALEDRIESPVRDGKHRSTLSPEEHEGGVLLALDAKTGDVLWRNDKDVFATQLAVSEADGILLAYYQAVRHTFFSLPSEVGGRIAAFDAETGVLIWDRPAEFKTRPIINGKTIYAEGGSWDLLTGEEIPWAFQRSYGCGQIAASSRLMVFRSATLGYLDLERNAGTENFGGVRTGCWFNAIPAGGLVLVPDGSAKCACSYQMQAWMALQPKSSKE